MLSASGGPPELVRIGVVRQESGDVFDHLAVDILPETLKKVLQVCVH